MNSPFNALAPLLTSLKSVQLVTLILFTGGAIFTTTPNALADTGDSTAAFYSTWKLMDNDERLQFVSGYKYACDDIRDILDIAITFVQQNPEQAVQGLESLKRIYSYSMIAPDTLASKVTDFYKDSGNRSAPLSKAISSAK